MLASKSLGNYIELACMAQFAKYGCSVSYPHGDGDRYDFIADVKGKILKVQCKAWANSAVSGCVDILFLRGYDYKTKKRRVQYTKGEVDYFATIWNDKCYVIPFRENERRIHLRINDECKFENSFPIEDFGIECFMKSFGMESCEKEFIDAKDERSRKAHRVHKCIDCGVEFIGAMGDVKRCKVCREIFRRSLMKKLPNKEELAVDLENLTWNELDEKYCAKRKTILFWTRQLGLPFPHRGRGHSVKKKI